MCDCIKRVNESLREKGVQLPIPWIGPQVPMIQTGWIEGKKKRGVKPPVIFPSYCFFCGEKYPDGED